METLRQDLRYTLRSLGRSRGFAAVAILTLALGIGANTALFSVIDGVLLRPLPFHEPDRLASVWPDGGFPRGGITIMQERAESYERLAAYGWETPRTLTGRGEPERLLGVEVTPELFDVLAVRAELGRTIQPGEERPGRERVVVLSRGLWERRFGADPGIVGQVLTLDGSPHTVVGVMPTAFRFPSRETELWVPAVFDAADPGAFWGMGYMRVLGRLGPGVPVERANEELPALVAQVREAFPWRMPDEWGREGAVVPLQEAIVGDVRRMLTVLLGAVGFVLLIACVNVANLLFARTSARRREFAIRTALGAGRRRLLRQFMTESLVLAALGGAAGVLLALWAVPALVGMLPDAVPRVDEIAPDLRVMAFAVAVTLLAGVGIGLFPALRSTGAGAAPALKEAGRGSGLGPDHRRASSALVVVEVALAVVLVVGAGLLVRSFWQMLQVDPGFQATHVVTATVSPPEFRYQDDVARRLFYEELLARVEALPGIRMAAVGSGAPFAEGFDGSVFLLEGQPHPSETGDWPWADYRLTVSPAYHRVLGVPVIGGRLFAESDDSAAPGVAIVSRSLAERYWPGENAVGKRLRLLDDGDWRTVVGVVGDVKSRSLVTEALPALYIPVGQRGAGEMRLLVRTADRTPGAAANLTAVVRSMDEDTPISDIRAMEELVSASVAGPRFTLLLLGSLAVLALLLGAIGVYGLLAYVVSARAHEIGIRMALGARTAEVRRLVLGQGLRLALTGAVLGLVGAAATTRAMSGMLFGVSATDPITFGAVILALVLVALAASYLPARRAASVDPLTALRSE